MFQPAFLDRLRQPQPSAGRLWAAFTGLCALMVVACWWKHGVKEPD